MSFLMLLFLGIDPDLEVVEEQGYLGWIRDVENSDGVVSIYSEQDKKSKVVKVIKGGHPQVTILKVLPLGWFYIRLEDGTEGYVDTRNVLPESFPKNVLKDYPIREQGYTLVYSLQNETLDIYLNGVRVISSTGSSGLGNSYTPRGVFEIEENRRGKAWFNPRHQVGFKYWVGFKGKHLFHSVPYDINWKLLEEEEAKLGEPASHGCIRLPLDISKYVYDNVPAGSLVLISD